MNAFVVLLSAFVLLIAPLTATANGDLFARSTCNTGYMACNPAGAVDTKTPLVGGSLSTLYTDILTTISGVKNPVKGKRDDLQEIARRLNTRALARPVCCAETTMCLLLHQFNVPVCYDRFTTNFFLPDGSYGSVITGSFTDSAGGSANLLDGSYKAKDGKQGNLYSDASTTPPNTGTLTLPTPYTAAGVGSAIAASNLGYRVTVTVTIPGTTIEPSVATTTAKATVSKVISSPTTILVAATAPGGSDVSVTVSSTATVNAVLDSTAVTTIPGTTKQASTLTTVSYVANKPTSAGGAAMVASGGLRGFESFVVGLASFMLWFL
ncbi:MAG: hypothetical protein M1814_001154 [Vezdaea aestivalis]|nr:MAG: hypothetical protein M1814_001154 [Vezdaea aestivalis]